MRLIAFAFALISCVSSPTYGEEVTVGSRVYVKSDATATVDGKSIDADTIPYPAVVEKIDGDWLWLGEAKVTRGDVFDADAAIADLTKAIEKAPNDSYSYSLRAMVWHGEGDYARAIEDNTEVLRLEPKDETALYNRGSAYAKMKDFESAVEDYSAAMEVNPSDYRYVGARGGAFYFLKQYDKAIEDLSQAMKLDPDAGLTYGALAWFRATCPDEHFRDGAEAVRLATKAAELMEWKSPASLDTLAAAYAELGDFSKAIEWEQKAIGLSTNENNKSRFRRRLKLYEAGRPYYEESAGEP